MTERNQIDILQYAEKNPSDTTGLQLEKDDVVETVHSSLSYETIAIEDMRHAVDLAQATELAIAREHAQTFRQAVRAHPAAVLWAVLISFTIVMEGYDTYLGGSFLAYPAYVQKYGEYSNVTGGYAISPHWQSILGLASAPGLFVGLILMMLLSERMGHRHLIMSSLVFITGAIFILFFAPNVTVLTVGFAVIGVPFGVFGILGNAYASEVCPLVLRGFLTSFVNICWVIGQLLASGVLVALIDVPNEWSFRIPFALEWMFVPPLFVIAFFAPDSPWWCVRRGKMEKAIKSIRYLAPHQSDLEHRQTLAMMVYTDQMERAEKANVKAWDIFRGHNLRRTEIATVVLMSQSLAGASFAYGSTYFFVQAGIAPGDAYKLGFGATALAFVGTCCSWVVARWAGRRTMIITGLSTLATCLFLIGCLHYAYNQAATYTQAAFTLLWLGLYSTFLEPPTFTLASEISATQLRSQTLAFARMAYNLLSLPVTPLEAWLINPDALNLKGRTAFVWMGTAIATLIWCIFRLPETKGITYTELDILFQKKVPAWKFKQASVNVREQTSDVVDEPSA